MFSRVKFFLILSGRIFVDDSNSIFLRGQIFADACKYRQFFFQGNKKNDSLIETYAWNKAWRSNIPIKITTNEIINKRKRFLLFFFKISYSKRKLQSVTKYLRLTLSFGWNSTLREKFNCYFSEVFC